MRTLRQRPLTSLFIAASVLLDLVLPAQDGGVLGTYALVLSQTMVVGGWAALGKANRLFRGAVYVLLATTLAGLLHIRFGGGADLDSDWGHTLLATYALSGGVAVAAAICAGVVRRLSRAKAKTVERPWRIAIGELLAWTAVVAVASYILRAAAWAELSSDIAGLLVLLAITFVAGLVMALFLASQSGRMAVRGVLAVAAIVMLFGTLKLSDPSMNATGAAMLAGSYAYLALWIVVQRVDWRLASIESASKAIESASLVEVANDMLAGCPSSANDR